MVVSLGEDPKHKGLVRPLVEQLERRMRLLVERDYRSAVTSLQSKCQDDLDQFFELVGQEEIEEISDNEVLERKHSSGNLSARGGAVKPSKVAARKKEMTRLILSGVLKALLNHADAAPQLQ